MQDNLDEYVSSFDTLVGRARYCARIATIIMSYVALCCIRPHSDVTTAVILAILLFERYNLCPPEWISEDEYSSVRNYSSLSYYLYILYVNK